MNEWMINQLIDRFIDWSIDWYKLFIYNGLQMFEDEKIAWEPQN